MTIQEQESPMTRRELLPHIFKLEPKDQLLIAEAIRSHIVGGLSIEEELEFRQELDRRVAEAELHPESMRPLEEVMAELRAKR